MRRYESTSALILMIVILASCAHVPDHVSKKYELTIIGTADLQGLLESVAGETDSDGDGVLESVEMGGIARIGTRIHEISEENQASPEYPENYMNIVQSFWTLRQNTDADFGFPKVRFQTNESYRETKRARLNAVLSWLTEFVDVHPTQRCEVIRLAPQTPHRLRRRHRPMQPRQRRCGQQFAW